MTHIKFFQNSPWQNDTLYGLEERSLRKREIFLYCLMMMGISVQPCGRHGQAHLILRDAEFSEKMEPDTWQIQADPLDSTLVPPLRPPVVRTGEEQLRGGSFHSNKAWKEIKEMLQIPNSIAFIHLVNQCIRVVQPLLTNTLEVPGTVPPRRGGDKQQVRSGLRLHGGNGPLFLGYVICTRPLKN